jgi:hypothetical protein
MKKAILVIATCCIVTINVVKAQLIQLDNSSLQPVNVHMLLTTLQGKKVVRVIKDSAIQKFDEPTFVKLSNMDFKNGTITVKVLSRLLPTAPDFARGFIGLAFRINDSNTAFESIYIRPTNGRVNNQLRRNRSVQYFSYPNYQFERLRKENSGEYETYADIGLNEWITLKIVVQNQQAQLYINNAQQPSFVVNDLKHGANNTGSIGLWVDIGTEGFFRDLKIEKVE